MRTIAERETDARCPLYARGSEHETEGELHLPLRREAGRQITSDCRNAVRDCAIVDVRRSTTGDCHGAVDRAARC